MQAPLLSLSTGAVAGRTDKAGEIVAWIEEVGARAAELNAINEQTFKELEALLFRTGIAVTSLHNFCPVPENSSCLLFISEDPETRERAVKATINTLKRAADVGAKAVVCHLDYVPMQREVEEFAAMLRSEGNTAEVKAAREMLRKLRREMSLLYLDKVLLSLESILEAAAKLEVKVGLETRCGYHEIPIPEELEVILAKFSGAPIGYWHDFGHAHSLDRHGFYRHEEILKRFSQAIIGVHIHDVKGTRDHLPPGKGEIDFKTLLAYIPPEAIKTIEVAEAHNAALVRQGLEHLERLFCSDQVKPARAKQDLKNPQLGV
ncbi:MAG: sugar phosphate isomerase/epimerase family protein [Thermacetogeniaceae bacterium]